MLFLLSFCCFLVAFLFLVVVLSYLVVVLIHYLSLINPYYFYVNSMLLMCQRPHLHKQKQCCAIRNRNEKLFYHFSFASYIDFG